MLIYLPPVFWPETCLSGAKQITMKQFLLVALIGLLSFSASAHRSGYGRGHGHSTHRHALQHQRPSYHGHDRYARHPRRYGHHYERRHQAYAMRYNGYNRHGSAYGRGSRRGSGYKANNNRRHYQDNGQNGRTNQRHERGDRR